MICILRLSCVILLVFAQIALDGSTQARAQTLGGTTECVLYENSIVGGKSEAVPVVPERLLANWQAALPCLVKIVERLAAKVDLPKFKPDVQSQFLSTTGAIRSIIAGINSADRKIVTGTSTAEMRENTDRGIREFIEAFRSLDNLEVTTVLSYGARSDERDVRSNALLILANVIDNSTLCVPLDHLYDPQINMNGRANLLAVVSVVASWAYRENYDNIRKMYEFFSPKITNDPDVRQTREILDNIKKRLNSQTPNSNKSVNINPKDGAACKNYRPNWATTDLRY